MKYIVRGSKNQNDCTVWIYFGEICWIECNISTHFWVEAARKSHILVQSKFKLKYQQWRLFSIVRLPAVDVVIENATSPIEVKLLTRELGTQYKAVYWDYAAQSKFLVLWDSARRAVLLVWTRLVFTHLPNLTSSVLVLQPCYAVITEHGVPFVRKATASLQIKISAAKLHFSTPDIYSEPRKINRDNEPQTKQWQPCFIQHLYHSSYFIISTFRNSVNFSITDITKVIENTPIASWHFYLGSRVIIRRIPPVYIIPSPIVKVIRKYGLKISTSTITYGTLGGATITHYTVDDRSQPSCILHWLDLMLGSLLTYRNT